MAKAPKNESSIEMPDSPDSAVGGKTSVMDSSALASSKATPANLRVSGTYESKKSGAFIALIGLSLVGFLLSSVLVVEGVFALAGIGEELIRKDDAVLGFRHRPNKAVTWRREGFSKTAFNSDGLFEEVKPGAHPGIYRVVVFGDSMVEGLQEPQDQGFVKLLEKELQGELPVKLQMVNCGVFGYSTVQACLYADEVINKYKPDLVLFGYDTRDMAESIETWVPSGKSLGGRPYAIKKPNGQFEISSEPVVNAMQQEKSKFWAQFDWFQQNSRIWGYLSENRPKLSLHNALVDAIVGFGKPADPTKKPSFSIKFFEKNKSATDAAKSKSGSPGNQSDSSSSPTANLTAAEQNQRALYLSVLDQTFAELLARLNKRCSEGNAKLIVFALPSRSDLLPDVGAAPTMYGVNFQDELQFVRNNCVVQNIPFIDCHESARTISPEEQHKLFFVLHLTPDGHKFIARELSPFLRDSLRSEQALSLR